MQRSEMEAMLHGLPTGTTLRCVFKKECVGDVVYLWGMIRNDCVVSPRDENFVAAIVVGNQWGTDPGPGGRTIEVKTTETFNIDWFAGRMARALETFEIIDHTPPRHLVFLDLEGNKARAIKAAGSEQRLLEANGDPTRMLVDSFGLNSEASKLARAINDGNLRWQLLLGDDGSLFSAPVYDCGNDIAFAGSQNRSGELIDTLPSYREVEDAREILAS